MKGYVEISEAAMRAKVQTQMGFTEVFDAKTKELLFQRDVTDRFGIRIYSSIAQGASRKAGADAIRVSIFDKKNNRPVKLEKRVHRTANALCNMHERARELYVLAKRNACNCGNGILVPRESKRGKFLGCSAFPACKETRPA